MSRTCFIDSHGQEPLHGRYRELLHNVEFGGYTPPSLRGEPLHGHGGWCAWDFYAQDLRPHSAFMARIFDEDGSGSSNVWPEIFRSIGDNGPFDYINNSWGSSQPYSEAWLAQFLAACGDATIGFAAGNDGRPAWSYPGVQLMNDPRVVIFGSCTAEGRRADWSETGPDDEKYADIMYLGEGLSVDGRTGKVLNWRGTSKSCPSGLGDLSAMDQTHMTAEAYWRSMVLRDDNANGIPDRVHPDRAQLIRDGGYDDDFGIGIGEIGRQDNMRRTGRGLGVTLAGRMLDGIDMRLSVQYHDFELVAA